MICNTSFATAQLVKEHITTHLAGLPFPCEKCDYSFETSEQLEEHQLKHAEMEYEEQIEKEVINEALQKGEVQQIPKNEEELDITEYTIDDFSNSELSITPRQKTNVANKKYNQKHPELNQENLDITEVQENTAKVVEKTKNQKNISKISNTTDQEEIHAGNYVPFLKDEVDSDVEEMGIPQEPNREGT